MQIGSLFWKIKLGLYVEVPFQDKELIAVNVVEPYAILLTYEDGSTEKKQILE